MKAKDILNNSAKKNMINWSEKDFKKSHPKLYKTIIEAIDQALIIDSVSNRREMLIRFYTETSNKTITREYAEDIVDNYLS